MLCVPQHNAWIILCTFQEMCGFLEHMLTNGKVEESNLTISYKATFTYNISKENTQVLKFVFRYISIPTLTSLLVLKTISGHTSCAKHDNLTTHY